MGAQRVSAGYDHCQIIQYSNADLEVRITTLSTRDRISVEQAIMKKIRHLLADYGLADVKTTLVDQALHEPRAASCVLPIVIFNTGDKSSVPLSCEEFSSPFTCILYFTVIKWK